jgi:hypothetical protein
MITHIVLIKLRDAATGPELRDRLMALPAQIPQIRNYEVGLDVVGGPRSYDAALVSGFDSLEDLQTYIDHPAHQEALTFLNQVSEVRVSCDYENMRS